MERQKNIYSERRWHDELVADGGRPCYPIEHLHQILDDPEALEYDIRPWQLTAEDRRVFCFQAQRWRSFCEWQNSRRSEQLLIEHISDGHEKLAAATLSREFTYLDDPRKQDVWTTWVEYVHYDLWSYDRKNVAKLAAAQHRDRMWQDLRDSGLLEPGDTPQKIINPDFLDMLKSLIRIYTTDVRRKEQQVAAGEILNAELVTMVTLLDRAKERMMMINVYSSVVQQYNEADDAANRDFSLAHWSQGQLREIENERLDNARGQSEPAENDAGRKSQKHERDSAKGSSTQSQEEEGPSTKRARLQEPRSADQETERTHGNGKGKEREHDTSNPHDEHVLEKGHTPPMPPVGGTSQAATDSKERPGPERASQSPSRSVHHPDSPVPEPEPESASQSRPPFAHHLGSPEPKSEPESASQPPSRSVHHSDSLIPKPEPDSVSLSSPPFVHHSGSQEPKPEPESGPGWESLSLSASAPSLHHPGSPVHQPASPTFTPVDAYRSSAPSPPSPPYAPWPHSLASQPISPEPRAERETRPLPPSSSSASIHDDNPSELAQPSAPAPVPEAQPPPIPNAGPLAAEVAQASSQTGIEQPRRRSTRAAAGVARKRISNMARLI